MDIIPTIINSALMFFNLTISIPLDFEGTKFLTFPLYVPFLVGAIINIIITVWVAIMINSHNVE